MAKRHKPQEYATVAELIAETLVPESNDLVLVEETGRMYNWKVGSAATADNESIINQTSVATSGRWVSITSSTKKLTGTVTFPALANAQSATVSATIAGLPIGSLVVANIANGDSAYTGGAAIPANVTILQGFVTSANTVSFLIINETGGNIDSFTANVIVTKL